jgi:hypothetical protein
MPIPSSLSNLGVAHVTGETIQAPTDNAQAAAINALEARVIKEAPVNVTWPEYGAVGDGSADDTAALNAAKAALPANGGPVFLPPGAYKTTSTLTLDGQDSLLGAGGAVNMNVPTFGPTTIIPAFNGVGIQTANLWRGSIKDLAVAGDRTRAAQDLIVVNTTDVNFPTHLSGVSVFNAGRDGIVLDECLNGHFDFVRSYLAKRHGLRATGTATGCNANQFTKCSFRTADQWGVSWERGTGNVFSGCGIESNSLHASTAYGGFDVLGLFDTSLALVGCRWENNDGFNGLANPLRIAQASQSVAVTETGSFYSEVDTAPVSITGGRLTSVGLMTSITPHIVIGAGAEEVVFVNPVDYSGGLFAVTDNADKSLILGGEFTSGPRLTLADTTLFRVGGNQMAIANGGSLSMGSSPSTNSYIQMFEQTTDPGVAPANGLKLFAKDNGSGKTQLAVRYPTGVVRILDTEV